ncbi:unnamed protein product [Linum trigynum]|uniref:Uncharacterized protein n=1 Tax=Linum trigynum TaxID=586398 RepID=A0AAV2FSJ6_9ROSI
MFIICISMVHLLEASWLKYLLGIVQGGVSFSPSFLLKRYILTGIQDGPHEPFIADSVDFVIAQVETLSKDDLA